MIHPKFKISLLLFTLVLTACGQTSPTAIIPPTAAATAAKTALSALTPTVSPTPPAPSPTPEAMAAIVNQGGVSLAEYKAEFQRFQAALKASGKDMPDDEQLKTVIDDMIDQVLLEQAAIKAGYVLSAAELTQRIAEITAKNGGDASFKTWLENNFYTPATFRSALQRSLAAAWQRDQVIAQAPTTADQVHARQILVLNQDLAERLLVQLKAGADFATLALQVDPTTGGELGWFGRGTLFLPDVEAAAFELKPGEYSSILKTSYGYHIVYVIERDANHPLAPDAQIKAKRATLDEWLDTQRSQGKIQIIGQ